MSLLLATRTLRDGSSTGVSSIFSEDSDLELTNTTVSAEMKWDCGQRETAQSKGSESKKVEGLRWDNWIHSSVLD